MHVLGGCRDGPRKFPQNASGRVPACSFAELCSLIAKNLEIPPVYVLCYAGPAGPDGARAALNPSTSDGAELFRAVPSSGTVHIARLRQTARSAEEGVASPRAAGGLAMLQAASDGLDDMLVSSTGVGREVVTYGGERHDGEHGRSRIVFLPGCVFTPASRLLRRQAEAGFVQVEVYVETSA